MKKINKPKTKHVNFPTMQFRLAGDDWLIAVHNPNNRQACYFLAEVTDKKASGEILGYFVSSLEREGIARSMFPGLPKMFKTTDAAADWIETKIEDYVGDEFAVEAKPQNYSDPVSGERRTREGPKAALGAVEQYTSPRTRRGPKGSPPAHLTQSDEAETAAHELEGELQARMRAL